MLNDDIQLKHGSFILTDRSGQWELLTGLFLILPVEPFVGSDEFKKDLKRFLCKYFDKRDLKRRVYYESSVTWPFITLSKNQRYFSL